MSSRRGLPGFLRRSRRSSYEEDDENDSYTDSDIPLSVQASIPRQRTKEEDEHPKPSLQRASSSGEASLSEHEQEENEEPPVSRPESQRSLSSLEDSSMTISHRTSTSSYRTSQFDKVLQGAEIVKLAELRKLGWNGIPVSTSFVGLW